MFQKGFLNKGSRKAPAKRAVAASSSIDEQVTPFGAFPNELIVAIVDRLASEPGSQRDLASLRLASKMLCHVATPHLYQVIQLRNSQDHSDILASLQAQPRHALATKAIWWDEWYGVKKAPVATNEPHLCKFENVEEVAYFINVPISYIGSPMGLHYGLREVGAWCEGVTLPVEAINKQLCTPTIRIQRASNAPELPLEEPKRAVWAMLIVVPTLSAEIDMFYLPHAKTIEHLCLDVYPHPDTAVRADSVPLLLGYILDREQFPLLKHLNVRLIDLGSAPNGRPTAEEIEATKGSVGSRAGLGLIPVNARTPAALAKMDDDLRVSMMNALAAGVAEVKDSRCRFFVIQRPGVERCTTRLKDVRRWTLEHWQERAYQTGLGAWREPLV